jgi:hypothetical protein
MIFKTITLTTCLYGSVYLFSVSLTLINNTLLYGNPEVSNKLLILNSITGLVSASIFCCVSYKLLTSE